MKPRLFLLWCAACLVAGHAVAAEFRVLVVMSYEEDNPWVREIRGGIDAVLGASSEITYYYMNTKVDREGGPGKAAEALALFQSLQPHGVIAADDDAQAMFVVPYLKGKVDTPVMFAGVNASAGSYGYPTRHISGVLERAHVRESLAFIKQLLPSIKVVCFLTNNVPAGIALRTQVEEEKASYPAKVGSFHLVRRIDEIEALSRPMRRNCDALFIDSLEGIVGADSVALNNREVLDVVTRVFPGPVLAGNRYQVEQGAWAAVAKTGEEQGESSAEMLLKAMRGVPVPTLPITRNVNGQRIINVTVLEAHRSALRPTVLRGATLVRQQR